MTGGRVFGYRNVRDGDGYVHRVIDEPSAEVVRRVFTLYAAGNGLKRIADTLNTEGVAAPSPAKADHPRGWAPSSLREVLRRELYRGVIVWNRSQKVSKGGTKKQRKRDASEWLRRDAPELRIVSDELWNAVQARFAEVERTFPRTREGGRLLGRPEHGESDYLLTGFATCALCNGSIGTVTHRHGSVGKRFLVQFYGCMTKHRRGTAICGNKTVLRQELLDRAVLDAIGAVLEPAVVGETLRKALAGAQEARDELLRQRKETEAELVRVDGRITRLLDVLADGVAPRDEIIAKLTEEKDRKTTLAKELKEIDEALAVTAVDVERLEVAVSSRLDDVRALLHRNTVQARQALRKLLAGKLRLEPIERVENDRIVRGYRFSGALTIERLLSGEAWEVTRNTVVAPTGFEPVFQP